MTNPLDDVHSGGAVSGFAGIRGLALREGKIEVRFQREGQAARGFALAVGSAQVERLPGGAGQVVCSVPVEALSSLLGVPVRVVVDEETNVLHLVAMPVARYEVEVESAGIEGLGFGDADMGEVDRRAEETAEGRAEGSGLGGMDLRSLGLEGEDPVR